MNVDPQLNLMHVEHVVVGFQIVISVMAQASMEMLAGAQTVLMDLMKVNSAVMAVTLLMATAQNYMVVTMYLIVV